MKIPANLRRLIRKTGVKVVRLLDPERTQDQEKKDFARESFSICKKLISKEESTLLVSPISGKRYIKSDDNHLYVIIEQCMITIVNHAYSYNIRLDTKGYQKIVTVFDAEVEKRREKMEQEIRSNVKHSLEQIYKNILNEQV
jgi:hypothetical protein